MNLGKVVIVTALEVEFEAAFSHVEFVSEVEDPETGMVYDFSRFETESKNTWDVYIIEIGAGNVNASSVTSRTIDFLRPDILIFLGVAGGVKDVKISDVVVGTKVYGYESGKDETEFKTRPSMYNSNERILHRARVVKRRKKWRDRIQTELGDTQPEAFVAPIAAGEKVVASTDSESFKLIKKSYGDALAVEMEGHGFLAGAHSRGNCLTAVIRGISDCIDGKSEADALGSQTIASHTAAAFCFQLLSDFTLPGSVKPKAYKESKKTTPPDSEIAPQLTPTDYSPKLIKEKLYSNIVPFEKLPDSVFTASCSYSSLKDMFDFMDENEIDLPNDWIIHSGLLISPNNLSSGAWTKICDFATIQEYSFEDWTARVDKNVRNKLLYKCLSQKLFLLGIKYSSKLNLFYFQPTTRRLKDVKIAYQSIARKSTRTVFQGYNLKDKRYEYFKHFAFEAQIFEQGAQIFLLINTSYVFTNDGYNILKKYESKLKGIKRLERNRSILNSTYFWFRLLTKKHRSNSRKYYDHLLFGQLVTTALDKGFDEKEWGQAK